MRYKKFFDQPYWEEYYILYRPKTQWIMYYDYIDFYVHYTTLISTENKEWDVEYLLPHDDENSHECWACKLDEDMYIGSPEDCDIKITIGKYNFIETMWRQQNILPWLCNVIKSCKEIYESQNRHNKDGREEWVLPT